MTTRLHSGARTTPRVRAEIRASAISDRACGSALGRGIARGCDTSGRA